MAIKGLSLAEKEQFISLRDPGNPENADYKTAIAEGKEPEAPTIFYIGNLTADDRVEIGDMTQSPSMKDGSITMKSNAMARAYTTVRRGLKGWENFVGPDGISQIKYDEETIQVGGALRAVIKNDLLGMIDKETIIELANAILNKNGMTTAMEKNFASLSQQFGGQPSKDGPAQSAVPTNNASEDAQSKPNPQPELSQPSEVKTES